MKLRVFTDGACSGNPGRGGWAAVFNMKDGYRVYSGNELMTTNNRMELTAVVEALKKAKENGICGELEIHSDSAYVINAVNDGWMKVWQGNGWLTSARGDVKNKDLWEQLVKLLDEVNPVLIKVKGHSGNTFNELADNAAKDEVLKAQRRGE